MTPDRLQEIRQLAETVQQLGKSNAYHPLVMELCEKLPAALATAEATQNDLTITAAMLEACRKARATAEAEGRRQVDPRTGHRCGESGWRSAWTYYECRDCGLKVSQGDFLPQTPHP